jgi:membrane-anchored glycerophosphoryl diester phosphodiesterase (GDPDase)
MSDGPGPRDDPNRPEPWTTPDAPWSQPGAEQGQPGQGHPPGAPGYPPPAGGPGYRPPPPRPGIIPLRPLGLGDILDGTVKLIRSNPGVTLGLSAVVGAITALPVAVLQAVSPPEVGNVFTDPATVQSDPVTSGAVDTQMVGSFLSLLLSFVATALLTGLLIRVLGRAVFGVRTSTREAWEMTRSRVWALLGQTGLVIAAIAMPAVLVSGSLMAVGIGTGSDGLVVVAGLSLVVWLPYALFMTTRLTLAPAALVLEELGAVEGMRRSWRLVRGDTWRVFGIVLLTQLLIGVVSTVVSLPFSLGGMALTAFGPGSLASTTGAAVLVAVGETVVATLVYPFSAGVYGLLYADRRMRAEAFDLELQTAAAAPGDPSTDPWRPARPPQP